MYTNKSRFLTTASASMLVFGTVISPFVFHTSPFGSTQKISVTAKANTTPPKKQLEATITTQRNEVTRLNNLLNTIQQKANVLHQQINTLSKTSTQDTNTTTMVLPQGMNASLLRAAIEGKQLDTLKKVSAQGLEINHFVSNPADFDNHIADVTKLSPAQQIEISQFVADMLNPVRQQLGNSPLVTSATVINFANDIARSYEHDNWNIFTKNAHDVAAIRQVARQYGLNSGGNYYENIGAGFIPSKDTNMHQLKYGIYQTVRTMLFSDASENFGHTFSLLGAYDYMISSGGYHGNTYFGMSFDTLGQDHYELVPLSYVTGKFTPGTTYPSTSDTSLTTKNNQLKQLNFQLADTQSWFRAALQKRDHAQSELAKASAQLQKL